MYADSKTRYTDAIFHEILESSIAELQLRFRK